ncbi:N-acetyl-alpha-D-glucosaminyl L-malate synthase BshA [Pseudogracilibacillus sp. ICA-222130]|uniref:N-acetyl-alpha-D-glucosaminyl L-malate synthase BshA n=1 Tax=Pseudogracilibacillus sp. ICA-222130 TaxID=3134655 RepID=UPI0030BB989F
MRKIGITCYPTVGGSGIIATELGKMLAERGFEIHFITSSLPFRLDCIHPNIYYHEVEINHYPVFQHPPYDLALAAKMADVIDREKLDILHVHYAMPHAISAILAKDIANHEVKIVTTLHGTDITVLGIDKTFKRMIKYGIEQSDVVTAVSDSLVNDTVQQLLVEKEIHVIYNFVNEEQYYKKDRQFVKKDYEIEEDENVVIHISNFRKVKRIQDVIQTFSFIQQEVKSKLLLVGDGPEMQTAIDCVKKYDMEDKVLFLGKQKNISDLLSISDLKLLMSEKESFGLVLLEAMACEVPTIGTDVGGIPEVIIHDETGFIVPLGDTEKAATYAIELLNDKEKLERFRHNALERVHQMFRSEKILNEYITLYDQLLANR